MTAKRRFTTPEPADKDLRQNPGIAQGQGIDNIRDTFEDEEGDNTVEGDVLNDSTPQGGVDPDQRGRTNK